LLGPTQLRTEAERATFVLASLPGPDDQTMFSKTAPQLDDTTLQLDKTALQLDKTALQLETRSQRSRARRITLRLLRLSFLVGLPILLLPALLPRRVFARRLSGPKTAAASTSALSLLARERQLQDLVDSFRARLTIPDAVVVSIVPENKLMVSVQRLKDHDLGFTVTFEAGFLDSLDEDELGAVIAHELGHVWIFTHHPYLQTEELANEVALRVVSRASLDGVYEKVWKRTGTKGDLVYMPAMSK
jgi:Peptidase family M48